MCGIAGLYSQRMSESEKLTSTRKMLQTMKSRGPDNEGLIAEGPFCLGHRRLSIIDTSEAGNQPISNQDKSLYLVANGEIYNFESLKKWLIDKGHQFKSDSDSEVLIHLYKEKGLSFLDDLRGMFGFALLDVEKKSLLLVRDRLGIKPVYYSVINGEFIFASTVEAILRSSKVPFKINPSALDLYLSFGYLPQPLTLVEGIYSLLPGRYLIYQSGELIIKKYWDFPNPSSDRYFDLEESSQKLRYLLDESIDLHSISDVPLGAFLSGGIDSSAVVGLMSNKSSKPIKTFSIGFEDGPSRLNELSFARQVSKRFQTDHQEIVVTGKDVVNCFDQFIDSIDQPSFDGLNTYMVSQAAKQGGLTVCLSGLGGDEVFGGYRSFDFIPRWAKRIQVWNKIPMHIKRLLLSILAILYRGSEARKRKLKRMLNLDSIHEIYAMIRLILSSDDKRDFYTREFLEKSLESESTPIKFLQSLCHDKNVWRLISKLEIRNYMGWRLLRDTDVMSMAHSLEVRVPLIDHKIVEYAFQLPEGWERKAGYSKKLLIHSVKDILPNEIMTRTKQGFEFPLNTWMNRELKSIVKDVFYNSILVKQGFFDGNNFKLLYKNFLSDNKFHEMIWELVVLELWVRRHQ